MSSVTCPSCGFTAHKLYFKDGHWYYVCERCGAVFRID